MASGTVGYTDTRSEKNYLGSIAKSIGNRLKQASNMASEERAYASKKAEDGGTSLEEAGIGKGYFFKRALGSRFGGDRIARTRGRLGATGPGKDPTKNYKQRFRGGFDYNVTNEIQSATVPLSGALVSGLRGVETGLSDISSALATMGSGMSDLARGQEDLAKATYFNGMILRVMVTEIKKQQSRLAGRREERLIEGRGGRGMLPGGGGKKGGGFTNMPGLGQGGRVSYAGGGNIVDVVNTLAGQSGNIAKTAGRAGGAGSARLVESALKSGKLTAPSFKAANTMLPGIGSAGRIISKRFAGTSTVANDIAKASSIKPFKRAGVTAPKSSSIIQHFDDVKNIMPPALRTPDQYYVQMLQDAQTAYFSKPGATMSGFAKEIRKVGDPRLNTLVNAILPELGSEVATLAKATGNTAEEVVTNPLAVGALEASAKRGGMIGRVLGKGALKSAIKKIPVIAGVAGVLFGIQRAMEGDFFGAALEITSGIMGATGVGAGASLGIDAYLLARDFGAPVPLARGGLLTGKAPVNTIMGEAGPEIVTPLNDETFIKFGEGFIDAAKRHKSEYSKILAAGNAEYFDKKPWWQGIVSGLENMLPKIEIKIPEITWPWQKGNTNSNPGGGRVRPGATAGSDTLNIGGGGGQMNLSDEQYKWLAYAISGEAGPGDDQYAVAASILNRVAEGRGTVEQVVKAHGQYEAYEKGMMKMSPEIEARLKSAEGQARLVAALERLQGRTDFKGQTQLQNRVAGEDPMVDALGNFFHYSWQTGPNSQMPSNYKMPNYQQFIKRANTGSDAALKNADIMQKWMQSIGGADQQANILGMNSTNASLAGFQMVTPTIVNNNYYTTGNQSDDDAGTINPGFNSMNLSAFTLPYSLAAKT